MKKVQEKRKRSELLLEQIDKLRQIKLPPEWQVCRLDVEFKRNGFLEEHVVVVYDSLNNTFYTTNNKCIIYPEDFKYIKEGIDIMKEANKIINSPRKFN